MLKALAGFLRFWFFYWRTWEFRHLRYRPHPQVTGSSGAGQAQDKASVTATPETYQKVKKATITTVTKSWTIRMA